MKAIDTNEDYILYTIEDNRLIFDKGDSIPTVNIDEALRHKTIEEATERKLQLPYSDDWFHFSETDNIRSEGCIEAQLLTGNARLQVKSMIAIIEN